MDFVGLFWQLKTWQPWRLQVDLQFHQLKEVRAVAVELRWKLVRVSTISIPLFGSNSFWRGEWMEGNIFQEALVSRRLDSFTRLPGLLSIAITFLGTRLSSSSGPGCLMGHIFKTAEAKLDYFGSVLANMVLFLCLFFRELGWIETCQLANIFETCFEIGPKPVACTTAAWHTGEAWW